MIKNTSRMLKSVSGTQAFTLIELIVSMLVFTLFIGVISTTYLFMSRSLREAAEMRRVYAEARFVMDRITQDVRLYTIDYDCLNDGADGLYDYSSVTWAECQPISTGESGLLPLIAADGKSRWVYRFEDEQLEIFVLEWDEIFGQWVAAEGYDGFKPFTLDRVALVNVQFHITPFGSPYEDFSNATQIQPSVNVVIQARTTTARVQSATPIRLQSTISSRVYAVGF